MVVVVFVLSNSGEPLRVRFKLPFVEPFVVLLLFCNGGDIGGLDESFEFELGDETAVFNCCCPSFETNFFQFLSSDLASVPNSSELQLLRRLFNATPMPVFLSICKSIGSFFKLFNMSIELFTSMISVVFIILSSFFLILITSSSQAFEDILICSPI